jgi:hypothetical protein
MLGNSCATERLEAYGAELSFMELVS